MDNLINILLDNNISISGVDRLSNGQIYYELEGFYSTYFLKVYEHESKFFALSEDDELTLLSSIDKPEEAFRSIVDLNYKIWQTSKESKYCQSDWLFPNGMWKPLLIKFGYIK